MEKKISLSEFQKILDAKKRTIYYTKHSLQRAAMRGFIKEGEDGIMLFEKDIRENRPHLVVEQDSDIEDARKFKVYYRAKKGFVAYIMSIDGEIELITVYHTSKTLQKKIYKRRKGG